MPPATAFDDPQLYINYQLSWLSFNERVLEEAEDVCHPLLERAKFLAIFSTNSDEFFMVRVAGLREAQSLGAAPVGDDRLPPSEVLSAITRISQELGERQLRCLRDDLVPALAREHVYLLNYEQLDENQKAELTERFNRQMAPVLTPLAIDVSHPFPFISNQSLSLLVVMSDGVRVARVRMPISLPRLVPVQPGSAQLGDGSGQHRPVCFTWLEQVVAANIQTLFPGVPIAATFPFRVIRNADVEIEEDEAGDLLEDVQAMLRARPFGFVTCLMVDRSLPPDRRAWLASQLEVAEDSLLIFDGPLGMSGLMDLLAVDRPDLKDPPLVPRMPDGMTEHSDTFAVLRQRDILVHHPYDSFEPVIGLIRAAAEDPHVRAIKQTLYRVGGHSPIVEALAAARDVDTEVAVLVELKARFDEESNIGWAQAIEAQGVHVAYGLPGLKVHSKVAMIVREEGDVLRRYLHLGTGNYNASTARLYTDLGLLTSRPELGDETAQLFNALTGYSEKRDYQTLLVAPVTMRARFTELIEREAEHARRGDPARLVFKMNQLTDGPMIRALYAASQAGVQVDLLVRGVCGLRPGLPGISERIRVMSIVGRFLEHTRAYYFGNGGADEIYIGSADLMPRNLDHRVEVVFPLPDPELRRQVRDGMLATELADTAKARELRADGSYVRRAPAAGDEPFDSQAWFIAHRLSESTITLEDSAVRQPRLAAAAEVA